MFDFVPTQAWIILALAITALGPAIYVWQHLTHSLTPRDITLPPDDLEWKSQKQLFISVAILAGLLATGTFAFTPQAEEFAKSKWFPAVVLSGIGSLALGTVFPGWRKGEIAPLMRGVSQTFSREKHPKRYWASLAWNAILGTALLAGAFGIAYDNVTPKCDDEGDRASLLEALHTCDTMLAKADIGEIRRADLLADRGRVHHRLGNYRDALNDYSAAIEVDPADSYPFYNRAIVHKRLGNLPQAIEDFDASLALRPDNDEAYLERGLAYLDLFRLDEAIADFTRLHERDPENPYALANRGIAYAWLGDVTNAERDFGLVDRDADGWPVALRGRAVIAFNRQDFRTAIRYLSEALEIDPEDYFALRMRGQAYWELGERDLARDDDDRSMALERTSPRN